MVCQTCPSCQLSVRTRFSSLLVQHCPRCVARRRRLVKLCDTTDRRGSVPVIDRVRGIGVRLLASEDGKR